MSGTTFINQLSAVRNAAITYLNSVIDKRGNNYELMDVNGLDDDDDLQEIADSGEVLCISNPIDEYIAYTLNREEYGDLYLEAECVRYSGEDTISVENLSDMDICRLADWVFRLESPVEIE